VSQSTDKIVVFTLYYTAIITLVLFSESKSNIKKNTKMKTVEIIMIPVSDQQKAKQFYLKLGFQVIVEAPMEHGQTWMQLGLPNQTTSIALGSVQGIIFETDDIEKKIEELKAKSIDVQKINDTPWGRFAWLKDLDGNSLCLHQK
jgi:predicted enzyme related to lactoylglutathione lyase